MSDVKVKVSSLTKSFGDLLVLDKISFSVNRGEFLCIVGPTGCGKTTFLNSLTKILETDSGSILIDGEEVNPKKHTLAYILQEYSALPWLNVEENIAYGLKIKGIAPEIIKERVDEAVEMVNMQEFRKFYPKELSASMLQRVSIARAFATEPELLLMDEPSAALDPRNRRRLAEILRQLPCAQLIASHDLDFIWDTCSRVVLLYQGKVQKEGPAREILADQSLLEACGLELPLRLQKEI